MNARLLNGAKSRLQSRIYEVNEANAVELRAMIRKWFGLEAAPDAKESEMRQTMVVFWLEQILPT